MTFQTQINIQPAPGVEGDFASSNPRATVLAGPGALVAGAAGVTVGRFAWQTAGVVSNAGTGVPAGFVHREMNALITVFLAESGNLVPQGLPIVLYSQGDFWAKVTIAPATVGLKAFASLTDGTMQPAAAGATVAGYIETKWVIASVAAVGEIAKITTWG